MKKTTRIATVFSLIGLGLWLITLLLHGLAFPTRIQTNVHDATIEFMANRSVQLFPSDCVELSWRTANIQAVYLNEEGRIGEDKQVVCGSHTFHLRINFHDGTTDTFILSSVVLLEHPIGQLLIFGGFGALIIAAVFVTHRWHRAILKQTALIIGFSAFAIFLALILIEIFLRLFMADTTGPITYSTTRHYFYPDKDTGWNLTPDYEFIWTGKCQEFVTTITTNAYGFRDIEWQIEKPANVQRIAFLGDSFVEAAQVAYEETPTQVLQQLLATPDSKRQYEVMNFGVSGYSVGQYLVNYRVNVRQFQPDYVVVLLSQLVTSRTPLRFLSTETNASRPTFQYDTNQNVIFQPITEMEHQAYSDYYATFQQDTFVEDKGLYLLNWFERRACQRNAPNERWLAAYRRPPTDDEQQVLRLNLDVIKLLNDEVVADGGQVLIVDISNHFSIYNDLDTEQLVAIAREFANTHNIAYVDLGTHLLNTPEPVTFFYDGHFNRLGYALFAESVFEWLQSQN